MDIEDLRGGPLNTALFHEIETASDVVVVLTPNSLDRCVEKDDWVRLALVHGIKCKKNIVPVMAQGFAFPAAPLPDDLAELPYYHGLESSHEYFDASMDRLAKLLEGGHKTRIAPTAAITVRGWRRALQSQPG